MRHGFVVLMLGLYSGFALLAIAPTLKAQSNAKEEFAGVSSEGAALRPDKRANKKLYGKELTARSIVLRNEVPKPARLSRKISREPKQI